MALLKPEEIAPEGEEARQQTIAEAITSPAPVIPGFKAVRHVTPLVMAALQRANNPYVTAKKGFDAMGIKFDGTKTDLDPGQFGVAMMEKTAEVLVCLTCDRDALKRYASDPAALQSAALDILEDSTPDALAEATVYVSQQLLSISKSRANPAPDEKGAPEASTLGGDGKRPKKPVRIGSRKS